MLPPSTNNPYFLKIDNNVYASGSYTSLPSSRLERAAILFRLRVGAALLARLCRRARPARRLGGPVD